MQAVIGSRYKKSNDMHFTLQMNAKKIMISKDNCFFTFMQFLRIQYPNYYIFVYLAICLY